MADYMFQFEVETNIMSICVLADGHNADVV